MVKKNAMKKCLISSGIAILLFCYSCDSFDLPHSNPLDPESDKYNPLPLASTADATSVSGANATLNGSVNANSSSAVVTFEYGATSSYGSSVTASQSPVSGTTNKNVSATVTGLIIGRTYHFRVKAVSQGGTSLGLDRTFFTALNVNDNDGNTYSAITIGTQVWLKENLKTTKYNDNNPIFYTPASPGDFTPDYRAGYSWYDNDASNKNTYGALYNWYVVNSGKLCPTGWHVPTYNEWTTLSDYLGGASIAGGKLKETGFTHWLSPNSGATNETGFTGLPGGIRYPEKFDAIKDVGHFWSSTEGPSGRAWYSCIYSGLPNLGIANDLQYFEMSVRCIKD